MNAAGLLLMLLASAKAPACGHIQGIDKIVGPQKTVLLGELHGTQEIPAFTADLVCAAVQRKLSVVLLLELHSDEDERFARYLHSSGGPEAKQELLAGPHWQGEYPDGRSSWAMVELIERMRLLVQAGGDVIVLGLHGAAPGVDGDDSMAARIAQVRQSDPTAFLVSLTGNIHARTAPFEDEPPRKFMGQALRERGIPFVSLDCRSPSGTAWNAPNGIVKWPGGFQGRRRFVRLGRAPGHDGTFYVPSLTASKPVSRRSKI